MIERGHRKQSLARGVTTVCALFLLIILPASGGFANEDGTKESPEEEIVFIPPASGAPADRLGAGTRDVDNPLSTTVLLSPAEGGVSGSAKPLLIWYFSEVVNGPITVSITPTDGLSRGFVATIEGRFAPGFHGLNLKRSQVELTPERLYTWDVLQGGVSQSTSSALIEYRAIGTPPTSVREAALAGFWYDALALLFEADFAGRVTLKNEAALSTMSQSAGLDLTKVLNAQE